MVNFTNPLPGVPNVESPFFDELFPAESTSPEILAIAQSLRSDGYAVFDFPDSGFEDAAQSIRENLEPRYDWGAWRSGHANMRIQDAWKFDENVRRLAANERVLSLLSQLYGRQAWPFQTLNFPVGTQQHVHTDSVHFSSMPERFMCGVWIALEDVSYDQGPLVYYPGSHRWPIYSNEHIGHRHGDHLSTNQSVYEPMWRKLIAVNGVQQERLCLRKGQAVIWTANLLHGGDVHVNKSLTRWSQVVHYYFENCAYFTPMESDVAEGVIRYRHPCNILTGLPQPNQNMGRMIDEAYISRVAPAAPDPSGFDAKLYLEANPDVAAAGHDPWDHFVHHGQTEGRRLRP